jgi:hypothetical protein
VVGYFFFGADGFGAEDCGRLAWAKSEAATDLSDFLLFGFDRILLAMDASFLLVVMDTRPLVTSPQR